MVKLSSFIGFKINNGEKELVGLCARNEGKDTSEFIRSIVIDYCNQHRELKGWKEELVAKFEDYGKSFGRKLGRDIIETGIVDTDPKRLRAYGFGKRKLSRRI